MTKGRLQQRCLISVLSNTLDILQLLERERTSLRIEDIHKRTRIPKTSVYCILKTLLHRGYLAQTQEGQFRLISQPRRIQFGLTVESPDLPFSIAIRQSVAAAAASLGVRLVILDNGLDPEIAIRNAEQFVAQHTDLVFLHQVNEAVATRVVHILKRATIPIIAIDVPHYHATYFGVDNFEAGYESGAFLARYAERVWNGKVDYVIGVGFDGASNLIQSRVIGAFEAIRARFPTLTPDSFIQIEGQYMHDPSPDAVSKFLRTHRSSGNTLVAAAADAFAIAVLETVRKQGLEHQYAIVGHDCIPKALKEIRTGTSALIGSVSHGAKMYGPCLIELGIAVLRGFAVPPYNYVQHRTITARTLDLEGKGCTARPAVAEDAW
jgi:ribose transport system substrate-binding protein